MSAYTEDADKAITAAQRTVEPGDLVTHEDDIGGILGRVFSVEDTVVNVLWSHSGRCVPVAAGRVHYLERPEAYAAVRYTGEDEIDGTLTEYFYVADGPVDTVRRDLETYRKLDRYTIVSYRLGDETPDPV